MNYPYESLLLRGSQLGLLYSDEYFRQRALALDFVDVARS
jgi:hypothetical protein